MIRILSILAIFVGLFLTMGAVGSDCDGKCIENAMSISEMLLYCSIGLFLLAMGIVGLTRS